MLFSSETFFEIRCVKPHELAESLEADTMANIIHALLVSNYIVVQGFEAWNFSHHIMPVPWRLNNWVIEQCQVIKGLNCSQ